MFALRMIPVYLALCALALAVWTGVGPSSAPTVPLGWALAGMVALYAVSAVVLRAGGSEQAVAHALDEAAQVNAARVAAPRANPSGETR